MQEGVLDIKNNECRFEDLCGDAAFTEVDVNSSGEEGRWDLLDGHILARIFHFLRADLKSLVRSALTCKHWQSVVKVYKDISRLVDFRELASNCSDSIFLKIMVRNTPVLCITVHTFIVLPFVVFLSALFHWQSGLHDIEDFLSIILYISNLTCIIIICSMITRKRRLLPSYYVVVLALLLVCLRMLFYYSLPYHQ